MNCIFHEIWLGLILGVLSALWPNSAILWAAVLLFFYLSRRRKFAFAFVTMGLFRACLTLFTAESGVQTVKAERIHGLPAERIVRPEQKNKITRHKKQSTVLKFKRKSTLLIENLRL